MSNNPSSQKPTILLLVEWFIPGYRAGGPIQSCINLVRALKPYYHFRVITLNHDHRHDEPYPGIVPDAWTSVEEGLDVYYFSKVNFSFKNLNILLRSTPCDAIYLNVLFSVFTLFPLITNLLKKLPSPIIVAPRGTISAGSLSIKSVKKKYFLIFSKFFGLYKNIYFHAASEHELHDTQRVIGNVPVALAPNFPDQQPPVWSPLPKESGIARFAFVARISPEKNIVHFVKLLQSIEGNVILDIYGPKENEAYWSSCETLIQSLPPSKRVTYKGPIPHEKVKETLSAYHFFTLPSLGENFGHSIFEALLCGKPVLLSDRTMWRNLQEQNLGWDISLDNDAAFVAAIQQAVFMEDEVYQQWVNACLEVARLYQNDPERINKSKAIFDLHAFKP